MATPASEATSLSSSLAIYHLAIERFRGIQTLSWHPSKGVNVILGGGDVGKTTILDAIALLFSPTNATTLSDTDYYARDDKAGFSIEAVVSLPRLSGINYQTKPTWPWGWNGREAIVPRIDTGDASRNEPVYRLRVRGTEDLGTADFLLVALRRAIGLVRLSGDDRNDRDLRLVQGSALDRLISDKGLRSRLASKFAKNDVKSEISETAIKALTALDLSFRTKRLPDGLNLAITGGQGFSIAALIGLTAECTGMQLPLASWGAGTRRIAALTIAEQNQGDTPITLVDEIERGLEPYRQRALMERLQAGKSQVFVTTHSPSAISAASQASVWYLDHTGKIGSLDAAKIARHRKSDPETFLSRLTVVAEGATELGFVAVLLGKALNSPPEKYGVHLTDGGGNETTLDLLEALAKGGLCFGGFADDEGKNTTRWAKVGESLGTLLFRWASGYTEENVIEAVPDEKLEALVVDPEGEKTGMRLRTLAVRLGIEDKCFEAVKAKAGPNLRSLIIAAASGKVPDGKTSEKKQYQAHAQSWFKTVAGGQELARKTFSLGAWSTLKRQIMPFCNAVQRAVGLPEMADIAQ
jgi:putative ATP-dependent endonuclease of OLD family